MSGSETSFVDSVRTQLTAKGIPEGRAGAIVTAGCLAADRAFATIDEIVNRGENEDEALLAFQVALAITAARARELLELALEYGEARSLPKFTLEFEAALHDLQGDPA